jgi:hypothetical protein
VTGRRKVSSHTNYHFVSYYLGGKIVILNVVSHKRGQMAEVGKWKLEVIKLRDGQLSVILDRNCITTTNKNRILAAD